ncbi:hypothetical protein EDC01DRAFT_634577 [Geopyxis carbonaria]|nr:hypothetical protein EDC01DRAFT_634577 [Geopyxis carbonaria]
MPSMLRQIFRHLRGRDRPVEERRRSPPQVRQRPFRPVLSTPAPALPELELPSPIEIDDITGITGKEFNVAPLAPTVTLPPTLAPTITLPLPPSLLPIPKPTDEPSADLLWREEVAERQSRAAGALSLQAKAEKKQVQEAIVECMGVAKMANRELAKLATERIAIETERATMASERAAMTEERAALEKRRNDIELADAHVRRFAARALVLDNILQEELDTRTEKVVAGALEVQHHQDAVTEAQARVECERQRLSQAKRDFALHIGREKQKLRRAQRYFEANRGELVDNLRCRKMFREALLEKIAKEYGVDDTEKEMELDLAPEFAAETLAGPPGTSGATITSAAITPAVSPAILPIAAHVVAPALDLDADSAQRVAPAVSGGSAAPRPSRIPAAGLRVAPPATVTRTPAARQIPPVVQSVVTGNLARVVPTSRGAWRGGRAAATFVAGRRCGRGNGVRRGGGGSGHGSSDTKPPERERQC